MSVRLKWFLAGLPLLLAGLFLLAWLALDAWLESAGGRGALERVLSAQSGYPVTLAGDFEVVLLPAPGVSGTDLQVDDPGSGERLLSGGRYAVALALRPLLRRELLVDRLAVADIRFGAPDDPAAFRVAELEIAGFAIERPADFRVDLGPYGEAAGTFTWRPAAQGIDLDVEWGGFLVPRLSLDLRATYGAAGLWLDSIDALVDGQPLTGSGCYLAGELNLDLRAGRLDLDALDVVLPDTAPGDDGPAAGIRLRLAAYEVVRGDTVAREVVLNLGDDPDCTAPAD